MTDEIAQQQEEVGRTRIPKREEVIGIIEQRLGGNRMLVKCFDGKSRICRVPGRLKRRLWLRARDVVLIEPWEYGGDEKGNILFKYTRAQIDWLKRKGFLKI